MNESKSPSNNERCRGEKRGGRVLGDLKKKDEGREIKPKDNSANKGGSYVAKEQTDSI